MSTVDMKPKSSRGDRGEERHVGRGHAAKVVGSGRRDRHVKHKTLMRDSDVGSIASVGLKC